MLRILSFFLIVLAAALGFAWLADHPGSVALSWQGQEVQTSVMVFVILQALLIVAVVFLVWLVRAFFKTPGRLGRFLSTRQRDRGYGALSTGILAAGAGDAVLARRMTRRSEKLLARRGEPLVRFLDAQTAMIEGDHDRARSVFEAMEKDPETRLLALRGLFLEAERLGDAGAARHYAERAVRIAPHVPWAGGAVLEAKAIEGDFDGALDILEAQNNARLIDRKESTRLRAVLLTGKAMAVAERDPEGARVAGIEAHKLAPDLAPAAVVAARALFRLGDLKRGAKLLERAWTENPHPEIAAAYVQARPGDSVGDRLKRAHVLKELRPSHVESSLAVAHAALDARDFALARQEALAAGRTAPREGVFLLLADIEEAETGAEGRVREWLGRAIRAPRDPVWTADGVVAEDWTPVSPVTGRLDAFEWKAPPHRAAGSEATIEADAAEAARPIGAAEVHPVPPSAPHAMQELPSTGGETLAETAEVAGTEAASAEPPAYSAAAAPSGDRSLRLF